MIILESEIEVIITALISEFENQYSWIGELGLSKSIKFSKVYSSPGRWGLKVEKAKKADIQAITHYAIGFARGVALENRKALSVGYVDKKVLTIGHMVC